eukprot:7455525-Pyramimonas_sp.AAC.1
MTYPSIHPTSLAKLSHLPVQAIRLCVPPAAVDSLRDTLGEGKREDQQRIMRRRKRRRREEEEDKREPKTMLLYTLPQGSVDMSSPPAGEQDEHQHLSPLAMCMKEWVTSAGFFKYNYKAGINRAAIEANITHIKRLLEVGSAKCKPEKTCSHKGLIRNSLLVGRDRGTDVTRLL